MTVNKEKKFQSCDNMNCNRTSITYTSGNARATEETSSLNELIADLEYFKMKQTSLNDTDTEIESDLQTLRSITSTRNVKSSGLQKNASLCGLDRNIKFDCGAIHSETGFNALNILNTLGKRCAVKIQHVQSPSEFYVLFCGYNFKLLEELDSKLSAIPPLCGVKKKNSSDNKTSLSKELGTHVLYYCICDDRWYRADVIDWCLEFDDKFVFIFNFDTGETKCVSIEYLQPIPCNVQNYPMFLQRCHLGSVCPVNNTHIAGNRNKFNWMKYVTEQMRYWIDVSDEAAIQITSADNIHPASSLPVILWLSGREKCVNNLLIDSDLAMHYSDIAIKKANCEPLDDLTLDNWNPMKEDFEASNNVYDLNINHPAAEIYGYLGKDHENTCWQFSNEGSCYKGKFCRKQHKSLNPSGYTTDKEEIYIETFNGFPCLDVGDMFDIEITHIQAANNFYCTTTNSKFQINKETLWELQNFINSPNNILQLKKLLIPPSPGQLVLGNYLEDRNWYRAKVLESEPENDIFKVLYVDYGNEESVPISRIRAIEPRYLHLPFQAIHCQIYGVAETKKNGIEHLNEIRETRNLFVEVVHILPGNEVHLMVNLYDDLHNDIAKELLAKHLVMHKTEIIVDPDSCILPG